MTQTGERATICHGIHQSAGDQSAEFKGHICSSVLYFVVVDPPGRGSEKHWSGAVERMISGKSDRWSIIEREKEGLNSPIKSVINNTTSSGTMSSLWPPWQNGSASTHTHTNTHTNTHSEPSAAWLTGEWWKTARQFSSSPVKLTQTAKTRIYCWAPTQTHWCDYTVCTDTYVRDDVCLTGHSWEIKADRTNKTTMRSRPYIIPLIKWLIAKTKCNFSSFLIKYVFVMFLLPFRGFHWEKRILHANRI